MKKIILIILIFLLFLCGSLWADYKIKKTAEELNELSLNVEQHLKNENWEIATKEITDLLNRWEDLSEKWSLLAEHQEVENTTICLKKSKVYTENGEKEEALAELEEFEFMMEHIPGTHKVNLKNIL